MTHSTRTRASRLSRLFGRGPRTPRHRALPQRLGIESLEDRIVLSQIIDVGDLRFLTPTKFGGGGGDYSLTTPGDSVSIGFIPDAGKEFKPLLEIDLGPGETGDIRGGFGLQPGKQTFSTWGEVVMWTVVVQANGANSPIPLYEQREEYTGSLDYDIQEFSIPNLLGFGSSIKAESVSPTRHQLLEWVDFGLDTLALAKDKDGGKVGLQGTGSISSATIPDLSKIGFVKDLEVLVKGSDFVWANKDGFTVTGMTGNLQFTGREFAGYYISGSVALGYSPANDEQGTRLSIGGHVQLAPAAGTESKLEDLGATILVSMGIEGGKPVFYGITAEVEGSFKVGGLTVTALNGFGFTYNFNGPQLEFFGGLEATLNDTADVTVLMGTDTEPGLVVSAGTIAKFKGSINADFQLGPVVISTSQSNGLNFEYDRKDGKYIMYGGVGIEIGKKASGGVTIAGTLGDATNPGIVYIPSEGGLQQANFGITGVLSIGPLAFAANDAGFRWVKGEEGKPATWEVHGTYQLALGVFSAGVELGTTSNPGIVVDENGYMLEGITVDVENVRLGPLNIEEIKVAYKKNGDSFDIDAAAQIGLPGGLFVGGEFVMLDGKVHSIEIDFFSQAGIPLLSTGLKVVELEATVTNIENPENITFIGKMGVVYGETISMLGKEVNLFHAEGDLTVDFKQGFIITCTAELGAYSNDTGRTWQSVLGKVEAKLDLNFRTGIYSMHVEGDGLLQIFDVKGDLLIAAGREVAMLAEANVVIPAWVPFIGGQKLAGLGFFFDHIIAHAQIPDSTTLAAWLEFSFITDITLGFEVDFDAAGNATWKLIGGSEVAGYRQALNPNGQTHTYSVDLTDSVPEGSTSLMAKVDWARTFPGVEISTPRLRVQQRVDGKTTIIEEKDFAKNGIQVVNDARLTSPTAKVILITNNKESDPYAPLEGDYTLLIDIDAHGGNPFPNFPNFSPTDNLDVRLTAHSTRPIFGEIGASAPYQIPLPTVVPTATVPITVSGHVDEEYLRKAEVNVALYQISTADPYRRPVLIQKVLAVKSGASASGFRADFKVPIDALEAGAYTLIAVVDDGLNPPVSTNPSAEFTPVFAVRGTVNNQNGTPVTGVPVYLDYNGNFVADANEPQVNTGPNGYAFAATFDPTTGWNPVPVGTPFNVVMDSFSPVVQRPPLPPLVPHQTVTFDGTNTVIAPFEEPARQGITGLVYDDTNSNGKPAAGQPVGGATVYLDTNNNGIRDDGETTAITNAGGVYAFADLPAGSYNVRADLSTVGHATPAEAYSVPRGTPGNLWAAGTGDFTYGMTFATNRPVVITSLGVFDDNSDGLSTTLTAVLYDAITKVELARLTFTPENSGTLVGGTRYLDLPRPITLAAGFNGMIAAYGFNATTDQAGHLHKVDDGLTSGSTTDDGNGRLSFNGGYYAQQLNAYPSVAWAAEYANPFAAGSFQYRSVPWAVSPSSESSYQVTLDASGSDLAEGRNFGLLPPTLFFGQVTGSPLVNGKSQQELPQSGVAMGLISDRVVLAIDSGGNGGPGMLRDLYAVSGTVFSTTTDIDTSGVPGAPAASIYQTARMGEDDVADGGFTYTLEGLSPGSVYTVRLHFAEIEYPVAGQRKFNVSINGTQVLFGLDVADAAGGPNTAITREFQAMADSNGRILLAFTAGSAGTPLVNAIQILSPAPLSPVPSKLAINVGGPTMGPYQPDVNAYATGGTTFNQGSRAVDISHVLYPVAIPVYETGRQSSSTKPGDGFTYTLPGFRPGRSYTVRLDFAELEHYWVGERVFNVDINHHRVLTDFDIRAAAGGWYIAYAQYFDTVADAQGNIVIAFTNGSAGAAMVNGIAVYDPTTLIDETTTDVQGNYALVAYGAGAYTVIQEPRAGWDQVIPNYGNPIFRSTTPTIPQTPNGIFSTDSNSSTLATADFNGDGRMDLVVASNHGVWSEHQEYAHYTISVLYGQADGSFEVTQTSALSFAAFVPLATVGDFNGDHLPDLAWVYSGLLSTNPKTNGSRIFIMLNTGDHAKPFHSLDKADVTWYPGDVRFDLNGDAVTRVIEAFTAVASGDIDQDGKDDLVLAVSSSPGNDAKWLFISAGKVETHNPRAPEWKVSSAPWINKVAIADVDGNGFPDVILNSVVWMQPISSTPIPDSNFGSFVRVVRRNDRSNWLDDRWYVGSGAGPVTGLAVGSVKPGALPNFYTISPNLWYVEPWPGEPATILGNRALYFQGINIGNYGDINGNGTFDWNVRPTWNAAESQPSDTSANFHLLAGLRLRDMNGDNLPDLVYLFAPTVSTQSIAIRINNGGGFTLDGPASVLVPLPSNLTSYVGDFEVADFDGDGLADIFVAGVDQAPAMLFRSQTPQNHPGFTLFAAAGSTSAGLDFVSVQKPTKSAVHGQVFQDVNGDGTRYTGEAGLAGAVVFADLNRNGQLDATEPLATTTATGHFVLSSLAAGNYLVRILQDGVWKTSTAEGDSIEVTVSDESAAQAEFGLARRLIEAVAPQTLPVGKALGVTVPLTGEGDGHRLLFTLEGSVPVGLTINSATGWLSWTPTAASVGTHTVTVRVRDPFDTRITDTQEVTVQVTAQNTPTNPTGRLIEAVVPRTVRAGEALDVTVRLTDAAVGLKLIYSLEGTIPAGLTIDPATGRLTWTPTTADAGIHTVTVRVRDPLDAQITDAQDVTVLVTARNPVTDPMLNMPAGGDWTVRVRKGWLEVLDRRLGLQYSQRLSDLRSLTIVGADNGVNRVTLDLRNAPVNLPGGIQFQGGTNPADTLQILLGSQNDAVTVEGATATVNDRLAVSWAGLDGLSILAGAGRDSLSVRGTPLVSGAITLDGGNGNDIYALATQGARVRIKDRAGVNTLDFRGASAGVKVDLRLNRGQTQSNGGGSNTLAITGAIDRLYGSGHDDELTTGRRKSVLLGGKGDDVLTAVGRSRHLLLGGAGRNVLSSRSARGGGSVLIGGGTAFDANAEAIDALLAEWSSGRTRQARIANLTNGSGSRRRLNGGFFLKADTLSDDGDGNELSGDSRNDWLRPRPGDKVLDRNRGNA